MGNLLAGDRDMIRTTYCAYKQHINIWHKHTRKNTHTHTDTYMQAGYLLPSYSSL